MVEFTVPSCPVAQPRHRVGTGASGRPRAYLPADHPVHGYRLDVWKAARAAYQGHPMTGPVSVQLAFVLPRPVAMVWKRKPMPRLWHTSKPDSDNLVKSTLDAMQGILWVDDCQVCHVQATKHIAAGDEEPHVLVRVLAVNN